MGHVRWAKGGEAFVTKADDDRVVLESTISSAPGSRLEGAIAGGSGSGTPTASGNGAPSASASGAGDESAGARVRVKVARCRKREGAPEGSSPWYVIEGRLLDATRGDREALAALALALAEARRTNQG